MKRMTTNRAATAKLAASAAAAFSIVLGMASLVAAQTAFAGKGGSPNGKPFVKINDQIIEVKSSISTLEDQVRAIVGKVDSLESRIDANTTAISMLETQNAGLQQYINQNTADITFLKSEITRLEALVASLQSQIDEGADDIADLRAQIADHTTLITSLQQVLGSVQSEVSSLTSQIASLESSNLELKGRIDSHDGDIASLQAQYDANSALIVSLQSQLSALDPLTQTVESNSQLIAQLAAELAAARAELQMKQNIISGSCPDGTAAVEVLNDGSLVCNPVMSSSGELQSYHTSNFGFVHPGNSVVLNVACAAGYKVTGGGYNGFYFRVYGSYPNANSWSIAASNTEAFSSYIFGYSICSKVAEPQ